MEKIIYIFMFSLVLGVAGCQKTEYMLFDDVARVQMNVSKEIRTDFYYLDESIKRDTVYLTVNTIGNPESRVREIALEQVAEYDVEYKYDNKGNLIDSTVTEKPYKAVPGVHYVAMDDPEMEKLLVVKPNAVSMRVPVILLRDTSLQTNEYRLRLKLVATLDFHLGESDHLSNTIIFSDKLSRPNRWNDSEVKFWGVYSTRKHEFMYEVVRQEINDEWFDRLSKSYAEKIFWKQKCQTALAAYNSDPENIANGLAPMREDQNDPKSVRIVFP